MRPKRAPSRGSVAAGWVLTGLSGLLLFLDGASKALEAPLVAAVGVAVALSSALYLVPKTSLAGAVLLSGYLFGSLASHASLGHPLFGYVLFPAYLAAMVWGGLYLRDRRVRKAIASALA